MERQRYIEPSERRISRRGVLRLAGATALAVPFGFLLQQPIVRAAGQLIDNKNLPPVLSPDLPPLPEFKEPETNQKVLAIPLAALGDRLPFTQPELDQTLAAVNTFFDRVAYGKMQFSFTTLPWQYINQPLDINNEYAVSTAGDKIVSGAATNDQFITRLGNAIDSTVENIDQYQTRMYFVSTGPAAIDNMNVSGLTTIRGVDYPNQPDKPPFNRVWLFGKDIGAKSPDYVPYSELAENIEHELGHTLGLNHEGSYSINETTSSSGTTYYPLHIDGKVINFDITQRVTLGWVTRPQIIDVTESGLYDLASLDMREPNAKLALRMQNPYSGLRYYVSYIPEDSENPVKTSGLKIYHWGELKEYGADEVLFGIGKSAVNPSTPDFVDHLSGISIKTIAGNETGARIQVTLNK